MNAIVSKPSPFQLFAPHLRELGFRKTWSTRSGGERMNEWKRTELDPNRILIVQVYANGGHRISHDYDGYMTTHPTSFTDPDSLVHPIVHEKTRQDNRRLQELKAAGPVI